LAGVAAFAMEGYNSEYVVAAGTTTGDKFSAAVEEQHEGPANRVLSVMVVAYNVLHKGLTCSRTNRSDI